MPALSNLPKIRPQRSPWNEGRIAGQKRSLLHKHVCAIHVRLELANSVRHLARFSMAVGGKLRGCDLVRMKAIDVFAAGLAKERASIIQSKTGRSVQFEPTE